MHNFSISVLVLPLVSSFLLNVEKRKSTLISLSISLELYFFSDKKGPPPSALKKPPGPPVPAAPGAPPALNKDAEQKTQSLKDDKKAAEKKEEKKEEEKKEEEKKEEEKKDEKKEDEKKVGDFIVLGFTYCNFLL